jgi:uncharacterized protein YjbJ (UPF0337 family)
MGIANKDEMKGKWKKVKGSVKEKVGDATDNPELIQEGQDEKTSGRAQEGYGKARRKLGEAIEEIGEKVGR